MDARVAADVRRFADAVQAALGADLVCIAVHGSAASGEWVPGRSDVNTVVVVPTVTITVLDRLAPVVATFRARGFALPVVMDREYLAQARDTFPMELEDIRRQHAVVAGTDAFADLRLDHAALRQECEREARGKLLRLRALYFDARATPGGLEHLLLESQKSFLVVLRHLLWLRGVDVAPGYAAVVAAGERLLGPLPVMRQLLARRTGAGELPHDAFAAYLGEVGRVVAAVDATPA
jgi:predicted nucleotidyltransferase